MRDSERYPDNWMSEEDDRLIKDCHQLVELFAGAERVQSLRPGTRIDFLRNCGVAPPHTGCYTPLTRENLVQALREDVVEAFSSPRRLRVLLVALSTELCQPGEYGGKRSISQRANLIRSLLARINPLTLLGVRAQLRQLANSEPEPPVRQAFQSVTDRLEAALSVPDLLPTQI